MESRSASPEWIVDDDHGNGYHFEINGLCIERELTEEEWARLGKRIALRLEGSAWAVGDWLVYGGGREWLQTGTGYPGTSGYKRAIEITGLGYKHLGNCYRVAKAYPQGTRFDCAWYVHKITLAISDDAERAALMKRIVEGHWTADDVHEYLAALPADMPLKVAARARVAATPRKDTVRCPTCGTEFRASKHRTMT
jgi:hypothetical protein